MDKKVYIFLALILSVCILLGCQNNQPTAVEVKRLGLIISTLDNPFFVTLKNGVERRAEELGYEVIIYDSDNDPAIELSNVEKLVGQDILAILINPVQSDSGAVKIANKANIPAITLDRLVTAGVVKSHVASDNVAGGRMAAEYLIAQLPSGAKVVELVGIPGASVAKDRGKGFDEAVADKFDIIIKQPADFDRLKGFDVMKAILKKYQVIDAVFAQNDEMALGALRAIEESGRKGIIVVGFDATDDALAEVKKGNLAATVAQKPESIGSRGVDVVDMVIKGQSVDKFIPVELQLISR